MNDKKILQLNTTSLESFVHDLIAQNIESIQKFFSLDSVSYAAVLGAALGEMIAAADVGSEKRLGDLTEEQLEPLKQTLLLNFNAAYNRVRSELVEPVTPKKEIP
jgi:hypothetical protein